MRRITSSPSRPSRGFTLVELMVVAAIIVVLSSLLLSGLVVAQSRARADATRGTIRKIHELIMPQYEAYLRRRVPVIGTTGTQIASSRLLNLRSLLVREMPDSWSDVFANPAAVVSSGTAWLQTGPVLAYAATKQSLSGTPASANDSAECLYLVTARAGLEADAMDRFRDREIGDTDGDQAPEFLDGWGNPIVFVRWAPGYSSRSVVQKADATNFHDPLDPLRVDSAGYALIPLIASAGPDGQLGLTLSSGWNSLSRTSIVTSATTLSGTFGTPDTSFSYDNITNHDLTTK